MLTMIDPTGELGAHHVKRLLSDKVCGAGYDVRNRHVTDMKAAGVIDAVYPIITALRVASSIAGLVVLTEALVTGSNSRDARSSIVHTDPVHH